METLVGFEPIMDGEPVAKLSIAPRSRDDARIAAHLDTFARRVEATPPGMCPLAVQLTMLQTSGAQTCGKCVPCRDGIPQLAAMLKRVVDCEADEGVLEGLRALAMEEQRGQDAGCWAVFHKDLAVMLGDMRNARGVLDKLHERTWQSADRSPEAMCEAMRWSEEEGEKFL